MNGTEQQQRHTAVQAVQTQIDDVGVLVEALDTKVTEIARYALAAVDDERASTANALERVLLRLTNLEHDDLEHERVIVRVRPLAETTFVQRLSWLLTGRT